MGPHAYTRRTSQVQALRYDGSNEFEVAHFMGGEREVVVRQAKLPGRGRGMVDGLHIRTIDRTLRAAVGDWIVREDDSVRVMKDAAFQADYIAEP